MVGLLMGSQKHVLRCILEDGSHMIRGKIADFVNAPGIG